ncbi:MAG: LamG-like jellyroll fold domain-containing protein [Candidatus Methylacidiphilales bacterium]
MKKIITTVFAICASASLFGQSVPTNGLKARYSFDDSKYNDISGNNNNLKEIANKDSINLHTYTLTMGKIGKCLNATGTLQTGLSEADSIGNLKFTSALSISAWVFVDFKSIIGNGFIASNRCDATQETPIKKYIYNNYSLWIAKASKNIQFTVNDVVVKTSEISDSSWHHIVVTYDAGTAKIYIDGTLNSTSTEFPNSITTYKLGSVNPLSGRLQIGSIYVTGASQSNALIDELYLYDRAIGNTEVNQIYNYVGKSSSIALNTIKQLEIFPNPTNNILNLNSDLKFKTVSIINSIGQISVLDIFNNTVNVSMLLSGVYVIQIKDEKGNLYTNKIIKE